VEANGNAETLRSAGLIDDADEPLPGEYYTVIEEMSVDEISTLVSLRQRLNQHGIRSVPLTGSVARDDQGIVVL
jgi:hypothetical protein